MTYMFSARLIFTYAVTLFFFRKKKEGNRETEMESDRLAIFGGGDCMETLTRFVQRQNYFSSR